MKASDRLVALNARISPHLRRDLGLAVARRGITIQQAVEEALRGWLAEQSRVKQRYMGPPPVIKSSRPGTLHLTNEQIDEILFG